ncbi:reverse transcriptase domain-containing protein [Tanacetum coccineum]
MEFRPRWHHSFSNTVAKLGFLGLQYLTADPDGVTLQSRRGVVKPTQRTLGQGLYTTKFIAMGSTGIVRQEEGCDYLFPILALPDGQEDFVVYCDASDLGLGCVLMQRGRKLSEALKVEILVRGLEAKGMSHNDFLEPVMVAEPKKKQDVEAKVVWQNQKTDEVAKILQDKIFKSKVDANADSPTEEAESESNVWDDGPDDVNPFGRIKPRYCDRHYHPHCTDCAIDRDDPIRSMGLKIEILEFTGKVHPDDFIDWLSMVE